jgi:hypothetical protein
MVEDAHAPLGRGLIECKDGRGCLGVKVDTATAGTTKVVAEADPTDNVDEARIIDEGKSGATEGLGAAEV